MYINKKIFFKQKQYINKINKKSIKKLKKIKKFIKLTS